MLNFDSLSLKAFIKEYESVLTGGRVFKIQQPSRNEILITVRIPGDTHKLYINVDPKYPHLAVLSKEGEQLRNIEIPKAPPMFCMLLRKYMEGSKIKYINQPEFERIFEICFESYGEMGERVEMVLSCEFMGKHSNIILYNYETNVILGCAHNVSSEKSRERELSGGLPYIYPPKQNKIDILKLTKQDFYQLIKQTPLENFGYMNRALASELINSCEEAELYDVVQKTVRLENLNPSISADNRYYSLISLDKIVKWQAAGSVNSLLDRYFGYHVFQDKFNRLKSIILKGINKDLKQARKLLSEQEKLANSDDKQEKYKALADNIMANLYTGEATETAEDAQKYYKLYKKAKTAAQRSRELMQNTLDEIKYLESIEQSLNQAETMQDLEQIKHEISGEEPQKQAKENLELLEFTSTDGYTILAGKNNKQNEYLLKNSAPEDIWLHVQNIPGSHVIIKTKKDEQLPQSTLHEAVYIAAYYSSARESSNVPVVYTKRKYVKKPAGSKPGFVVYNNEKTLWVNPEREKIEMLKKKK